MSECKIAIEFTAKPEEIVARAKGAIAKAGGTLTGDSNSGSFHLSTAIGRVAGSYQIASSVMNILVTEKPIFLSCGMIEGELRKYLS